MDEQPGPDPVIHRTAPAAARVEGRPGMLVASVATDTVLDIASEHGFAVVTAVGSSSSSGSLTYYVDRLASAGLVSFVSGNTLAFATPRGGQARTVHADTSAIVDRLRRTPMVLNGEVRIPGERTLSNRDAALERGVVDVDEASLEELLTLVGETR